MRFFFVLALVVAACEARPSDNSAWSAFKSEFKKVYTTVEEEVERYKQWLKNLEVVKKHNAQFSNSYTIGETRSFFVFIFKMFQYFQ